MEERLYEVGFIMNTHGIKGEVKVRQITDFKERFDPGATVYLKDEKEGLLPLTVESSRPHKHILLVKFNGYDSINDVEKFKGKMLYIKHEQLTELGPNEYYYHEIIGCTVKTTEGETIGVVESILAPGANDVFVVKDENDNEYLIPHIEPVVKHVDVDHKVITIEVMEGLLD